VIVPAKRTSAFVIRKRRIGHLMRHLLSIATWLTPTDFATARSYCECQVVGAELFAKIIEKGVEKGDGETRGIVMAWRQIKTTELSYAAALGLSPKARAELRQGGRPDIPVEAVDVSPATVARVLAIAGNQDAEKAETE
jgi:hypothetical protein